MLKAIVYVTIKEEVLDSQGKAVEGTLQTLGFREVEKVRIGKYIEITLDTQDRAEAEKRVEAMCEQLLMNPNVENYRYELEG